MTVAAPMTAGQQEAEASRPLIIVSYLCILANEDNLPEVRLKDLRDLHPELVRAGVHPVVETTTAHAAVKTLLRLHRPSNCMLIGFVIRGEEIRAVGFAVLLTELHRRVDRNDLAALFRPAGPGDRVVVIGLRFNERHRAEGLSGVYRVFTLT